MAKVIAHIEGIALVPGVSKNGRYYSRELVARAVERAQQHITGGGPPMAMLTHHEAEDDSTRIVGRLTGWSVDESGRARYKAAIVDNEEGRKIASLIDTSDGAPAFLEGVSIRGNWLGEIVRRMVDGRPAECGDDLELEGLDFTKSPGVPGARVEAVAMAGAGASRESVNPRRVVESVSVESVVAITEDGDSESGKGKLAPPFKKAGKADDEDAADETDDSESAHGQLDNGTCKECGESAGPPPFADQGYQDDGQKRYPVGDVVHAKAAWVAIGQSKSAEAYTGPQLKRVKGRIASALTKHGVKVNTKEGWLSTGAVKVEEGGGHMPGGVQLGHLDPFAIPPLGGLCVALNNRIITVTVSSHLIDPADLEVVGAAAMRAANAAIKVMDPDEDGDIDIPGTEDQAAKPVAVLMPGGYESAPTDPSQSDPEANPAAETKEEEPGVSEPTINAAVPAAPAAPSAPVETAPAAAAGAITLSADQFAELLARVAPVAAPVEAAPAAPAVEAAPAAPAAVQETEAQRVERLVAEQVQSLVASGAVQVQRKGVVDVPGGVKESGRSEAGLPIDAPDKPLHDYTSDEWRQYARPYLEQAVLGKRSVYRQS